MPRWPGRTTAAGGGMGAYGRSPGGRCGLAGADATAAVLLPDGAAGEAFLVAIPTSCHPPLQSLRLLRLSVGLIGDRVTA